MRRNIGEKLRRIENYKQQYKFKQSDQLSAESDRKTQRPVFGRRILGGQALSATAAKFMKHATICE